MGRLVHTTEQPTSLPQARDCIDDEVDHVIRQLNRLASGATFDFACSVGRLIVDRFYAGDLARWRARDPETHMTFRRLSRHPDLPMSAGALYRSVSIYEVCERLGITRAGRICTSHVRLVLPLPAVEQERLLRTAEANGWTVGRLDLEVAALLATGSLGQRVRGGRKRHGHLRRAMRDVEKCSSVLDRLLRSTDDMPEPSPDSTHAAIHLLRSTARKCELLQARLAASLGDVSPAPAGADPVAAAPTTDQAS
jgi:hypothetical protein